MNRDIEKAIEELKGLNERSSKESELFKKRHGRNFGLAISALEKQISISRIIKNGRYYCPKCDAEMKTSGYCSCGQRLY